MAVYSSGSTVAWSYIQEVTFGMTPATPAMKVLRAKPSKVTLKKTTYTTDEVRADRGISDVRHGQRSVDGTLDGDLMVGGWDDLIQAALQGTWTAVATGSASLAATAANSYTRTVGSFITDGFQPGDEVMVSGFATGGNNGRTKVVSVVALTLTVAKVTTVDTAAAARFIAVGKDTVLTGWSIEFGTTLRSFTFEQGFTDINQFRQFKGVTISKLKITAKPGAMVEASFTFLGADAASTTVTIAGSSVAAATNSPMSPSVGTIQENNLAIAYITSVEFELDNGLAAQGVVGSDVTPAIFNGRSSITGTVTALFKDQVMMNKFLAETESNIDLVFNDPNGTDFHHVRLPRIKYTGADTAPPKDGATIITMPFTALVDPVTGSNIIWQRSNNT